MRTSRFETSLKTLIEELERMDKDLARMCLSLPEPVFEPESDRPLNLSAELYGLLTATRQDELAPAVASLRQALELSEHVSEKK